jgi:hypothetical protein
MCFRDHKDEHIKNVSHQFASGHSNTEVKWRNRVLKQNRLQSIELLNTSRIEIFYENQKKNYFPQKWEKLIVPSEGAPQELSNEWSCQ